MPSKLNGPDFEDFTVTSENLRWYHSCRWEESHTDAFQVLRASFSHSFGKAPNLIKSKTQLSPLVAARWLLIDEEDCPLAWAELQSFPGHLDRWGVLLWGGLEDKELVKHSLVRLISFCFIVGKFDHLKIGAAIDRERALLETLAETVGERRISFSLPAHVWHPESKGLIRMMTLELPRYAWLNSSFSQDPSKSLQHIQARISRFEKSQSFFAPKQKRRSLIARLLRPKIEDSLF